MLRKSVVFALVCILTACMTPQPLTVNERYKKATETYSTMFAGKPQTPLYLDYYEALARTVKCNLDYRLKLVNIALQAGQLDVAVFTMLPAINASSTLYTRNNDYSVSGITGDGVQTGLSSSTPRTLRTARIAMSWNILDFAMGYVKAKQQSDRLLIAQEESRRQLQQLGRDLLVAYWVAYSAQQLIEETMEFQRLLTHSKQLLEGAMRDKLVPQESILNYQAALLEGDRKLIQLQYKYDKAILDLKHLLFLPVDQKVILATPPAELFRTQNLRPLNLHKMDAVTLVHHPELRGQNYQERIAKFGVKTVVLQALPGLTFNYGWNYDSNQFLLNNTWLDKSADVAWNLLNVASLPASYKTAKMQAQYENVKAMALTMAALTGTRYAFRHYVTLNEEYQLAHKQTLNARALYKLNRDRKAAAIASDQQVILAKLKAITTRMDEDLLLSDLSVALGELYLSVGIDIVPDDILYKSLPEATAILRKQLHQSDNFVSFINIKYDDLFRGPPQPKPRYTIQLCASNDLNIIKAIQRSLNTKDQVFIAKATYQGKDCYVLTYGRFSTQENAASYQFKLPHELARFSPRVRKIDTLSWLP
jgi:outer membrane protein